MHISRSWDFFKRDIQPRGISAKVPISQLSARYQFGAIDTADTTDGKVTHLALLSAESEKDHRLCLPHSVLRCCRFYFR